MQEIDIGTIVWFVFNDPMLSYGLVYQLSISLGGDTAGLPPGFSYQPLSSRIRVTLWIETVVCSPAIRSRCRLDL